MAYVQVLGKNLYFEEIVNDKPPLLLIHGAGQDTLSWRFNLDVLSDMFHVYVLDLPGHGKSELAAQGALDDYNDFIPFVAGFMEALSVPHYALMCHSFAGGLALHLALKYPERVSELVLIDGTGCPSKAWGGDEFKIVAINPVDWLEVNFRLICGPETPVDRANEIAHDVRRCCAPEVATGDIAAFAKTDLREHLGKMRTPILLLHGEHDWSIPPGLGQETYDLYGGPKIFKLLPSVGHFPHTEQPEMFNSTFLEGWQELKQLSEI